MVGINKNRWFSFFFLSGLTRYICSLFVLPGTACVMWKRAYGGCMGRGAWGVGGRWKGRRNRLDLVCGMFPVCGL